MLNVDHIRRCDVRERGQLDPTVLVLVMAFAVLFLFLFLLLV